MKKYIDPISDILNATSKALYNFALVVIVLFGGGLGVLAVIKIKNILSSLQGLKSSSVALNNGSTDLLQISQMAAILAVVSLCIVILSVLLKYASKYMKNCINE